MNKKTVFKCSHCGKTFVSPLAMYDSYDDNNPCDTTDACPFCVSTWVHDVWVDVDFVTDDQDIK